MTERERLCGLICKAQKRIYCGDGNDCIYSIGEYCYTCHKIADYLIDQGVFAPPCKVGDKVYVKNSPHNITECTVYNICTNIYADNHDKSDVTPYWVGFEIRGNDIGKTVFLSREEAEKALRERKK